MLIICNIINMIYKNHFILASQSKSRLIILKKLNLKFKTKKHTCDEDKYKKELVKKNCSPKKISLFLAKEKAKSIKLKNEIIIGSDTVISFNDKMIEKAKSLKEAEKKLKKLSGKTHIIISSAVAYFNNKPVWKSTQKTFVKIRPLSTKEIKLYLKNCGTGVLSSVGCYQIEKNGPDVIENIKGDFFNVMGFPLFPFLKFLKRFNIKK